MGSLDDTLRLEASETSPLAGDTPFASATRPTSSGLQWLAVPSGKAGLAYRIVGGTSLERLEIGEGVSLAARANIHAPATHICTCFDGRLVAVTCIDGSMECFDSTASSLESRWIVPNCHSHVINDLSVPPSSDRSKAASASGPVRSFCFAPSSYELLLVDAQMGSLAIYNAANSEPTNELIRNSPSNVLSAVWSSSSDLPVLAFGKEDGSIEICRYQQNSLELLNELECPHQEEEGFCCTHLDWSNEYLLVGLCKVEPSDDEEDEDDEDDMAEHEAAMYMTSMDMSSFSPGEWHELGDVVPFFSVPRGGRHAFFTSFLHSVKHPLCVVTANVGTDVAVLAKEDDSWAVVEFEEGNEPTTPTDDEDEFSFPIGVGVVPLASGVFQLLLPTTDGSLSTFTFQKEDEPEAVKVANALTTNLEDAAVEMIESSTSPPDLAEEPPMPAPVGEAAPAFGSGSAVPSFGSGYLGFNFAPATIPSSISGDDKPAFGSTTSSNPTFGSTSAFGSGGFGQPSLLGGGGFGQPSNLGGGGSSAFGQTSSPDASAFGSPQTPEASAAPVFGATTTPSSASSGSVFGSGTKAGIGGGFAALSAAPTATGFGATFSTTSPKKTSYSEPSVFASPPAEKVESESESESESETSTPQADKATESQTPSTTTPFATMPANTSDAPVFGSGSKAPSFTFGTSSASPFAVNTTPAKTPAESPFNAFSSSKSSPSQGGFMAKPLFGTTKEEEEEEIAEPEKPSTPKASPVILPTDNELSAAGKSAARVFDTLDEEEAGYLPIDSFENLSEELGEGFHGDEYDKQIAIIDPAGSGFIHRPAFIDWYTELVEGDDDDSSIDSDERAEREEERQKALDAFQTLSGGNDTIPESDFQRLIESLNTVYCEEEHRKTLKIIARGGEIHELDFLSWYVGWLFGGDESSDEEEEEEAPAGTKEASSKSESLSAMFSVDKDSWKCEICSVRNNCNAKKCAACDTVRPGFEGEVAKEEKEAAASAGSAIGSGGFSFGGSSPSGGIGSGGFAFGAPAPAAADSASSGGGGFTFGTTAPDSGESKTTSSGAGFTFGAPAPAAGGFTFGAPKTEASSASEKVSLDNKPSAADQSLSAAGKSAARVFDTIDEEKGGSLPVDSFENLSDELGQGFHGDECDKQIAIIDPAGSGRITRAAFIDWYTELVEGDDDGSSIDSEERAEREEERQKAQTAFQELSGGNSAIPASDFQKLIESLNTVYCEEEHRKTLKKITKDGKIEEVDFLSWYVDWLFGGDESSDEEEDDDGDKGASVDAKEASSKSESLSAMFSVDKDSWKCEVCSVRNNCNAKKCAACDTVRPGFEGEVAKEEKEAAASAGSAIGSGGFSFGGSSPSGGIGSGGFAFGAPAPAAVDSASSGGGGFTFGAPSPAAGGFTFGAPKTQASEVGGSSAFPPMSSKAPTPFGGGQVKATTSASSAAFPPMSATAPTPFSAKSTSTNATKESKPANAFSGVSLVPSKPLDTSSKKATTSVAAFPPMSATAPTPFSAKSTTTSATKESKLPNPFSGVSLVPSTPLETSSKKTTTVGGSSAFPPMSSKAPTPFGGGQVKATTSASSAAFPPMSATAPTPFSAKSTLTSATKESKPPNPFSGVSLVPSKPLDTSSKKATTSVAAFPPMSATAPTPFSAKSTPTSATKEPKPANRVPDEISIPVNQLETSPKKATTSASSAAFPPMSSKAPTPFGGGQAKAPTSGYPTVSSTAPTPFGVSSSSTSAAKASSRAIQPIASKAATPFVRKGQTSVRQTTSAVALEPSSQLRTQASSSKQNDRLGIANLRSRLPRNVPAAGIRFAELTSRMAEMLDRVGGLQGKSELDSDFEDRIQSMVDRVQNNRVSLTAIGTSVGSQRQTNTFLLSRKVDSERQVREAARLVDVMRAESSGAKEKLTDTQPLDYNSEMTRRKFAAAAIGVVGQMKLVGQKLELLEAATQSPEVGSHLLANGILAQYERTEGFKQRLDRIEGKLDKASQSLPLQEKRRIEKSRTGQSTYGLTTTPRKQRPRPIPLAEALTPLSKLTAREQNASSARKWSDMASSLQTVGSKHSRTIRVSGASSLKTLRGIEQVKPTSKAPSVARSLLLSPSKERPYSALPQSSSASSSTSITIFSPKTKTKARTGWDTVSTLDQARVKQLSFSVPGTLKEATLTDASRNKLDRFGTTPEKIKQSIDIKKSQAAVPTATRSQELAPKTKTQSAKKEVSSAAFPPMSSKAPSNPFSKTAQKSSDSKPPVKPKQATSYPPMSAVAPEPFTPNKLGTPSSSAVPKKETPSVPPTDKSKSAAKTDPFSTASMGNSLFSSGGGGSTPSLLGAKPTSESASKASGVPDYNAIMVAFYQKHNPAKIAEVAKTLEKYKGREVEMFQKLAAKYKVKSPLDEIQNTPAPTPGFGTPSAAKSPFASTGAPGNTAASPFQSSAPSNALGSASPFSSGGAVNAGSTFGKPPASPFGPAPGAANMASSTPFGSPAPSSTPFGSGGLSSTSPFGGAPSPSPFGPAAAPAMQAGATQSTFQGKDPRQMLMQFYQQYNPSKLGEVDKVLTKYKGKEEQLFRNLAKKYNLDASAFGLPPAPAVGGFGSPAPAPAGFGQASAIGGAPAFGGPSGFGQTAQMGFGATSSAGSGMAFGSAMPSAQGTSSFGSLAQAPSPSPFGNSSMGGGGGGFGSPAPAFGATSSMGFGGSTPFGAARR